MTWAPVPVDDLEAEPSAVRRLADDLRALGTGLLECGAVFRAGSALPTGALDGSAGDRLRSRCRHRREDALGTALELETLAGSVDELARDLDDLRLLLRQMRGVAQLGGLEVGGAVIWPPHPTDRHQDTATLQAAWSAYDRCRTLRETLETRRDAAERAWRAAVSDPTTVRVHDRPDDTDPPPPPPPSVASGVRDRVLPPATPREEPGSGPEPERRLDEHSRARWIEGHRGRDGEWVHAHWQAVGRDGHGSGLVDVVRVDGARDAEGTWQRAHWDQVDGHPHAGEHPSGATVARWVDGRWLPLVPGRRPPSVA